MINYSLAIKWTKEETGCTAGFLFLKSICLFTMGQEQVFIGLVVFGLFGCLCDAQGGDQTSNINALSSQAPLTARPTFGRPWFTQAPVAPRPTFGRPGFTQAPVAPRPTFGRPGFTQAPVAPSPNLREARLHPGSCGTPPNLREARLHPGSCDYWPNPWETKAAYRSSGSSDSEA